MRSDRERLLDILEAIEQIEKYVGKGRPAIEQDELLQTWFVHYVQVIGEAAGKLSDELCPTRRRAMGRDRRDS